MQRPNDGPQRTCVGCMRRDSKLSMMRIVATEDSLTLDEEGRMPGRGAYLHYRNRCITEFVHKRTRELRSLKRKISLDERRRLVELIHLRLDSTAALE
jgi:uncharacterized protein